MPYIKDEDLEFLKKCKSKDLDSLVEILTKDKDGKLRLGENLTKSELYKKYFPDHKKYWELIAEELQCYGANTVVTAIRGRGVLYKEILIDVCKKVKVNFNSDAPTEVIEMNLLMKIMTDSLEKMNPEELHKIAKEFNLSVTDFSKQTVVIALQTAIKMNGFAMYKMTVIIANAVIKAFIGRGLTFAANAALTKTISIFAGPIGWAVTALWTAFDIAGPAYRVTIPAVVHVAFLRTNSKYKK